MSRNERRLTRSHGRKHDVGDLDDTNRAWSAHSYDDLRIVDVLECRTLSRDDRPRFAYHLGSLWNGKRRGNDISASIEEDDLAARILFLP